MTRLQRAELYALAFFGGLFGQWTVHLLKHLWYAVSRHVILK